MGRKDRELVISGLTPSADLRALTAIFGRYGPCKDVFYKHGLNSQAIVCYDREEDVGHAQRSTDGMNYEGRRIRVALGKKKGGGFGGNSASGSHGWPSSSASGQSSDPTMPPPLAPAPRIIASLPSPLRAGLPSSSSSSSAAAPTISISTAPSNSISSTNGNATTSAGQPAVVTANTTTDENLAALATDTWELSLYDSDYDDGFHPVKVDNKPKAVEREEWTEAYDVMKGFARYGGAILAVDVESWDQNHDFIIEVGLAHVEWEAGNGTPPTVKTEHLIVQEHESKRNGLYSPDAKNKFAFGNSKKLTETDVIIKLTYLLRKLSNTATKKQPLILLFHNAAAEISYFGNMNIDISAYPTRVPRKLLEPVAGLGSDRAETVILDTQRLYKAFVRGTEGDEGGKLDKHGRRIDEQPMSLQRMAKKLGLKTQHLHNAGNDAHYTLQMLMKMAEMENNQRKAPRRAGHAAYAEDEEDGELMDGW